MSCLSTEGEWGCDGTGDVVLVKFCLTCGRCPYGDFLRESRRVTGPSSSSPVTQTINGPRQQKKTMSQNNTHITTNM